MGSGAYMGVRASSRRIVILAGLVLWAGSAWAGPGVIIEDRVEAFVAPSREASVAAEFGRGAPVCVLDETNHDGVLIRRPGWLAIRLPGGVGYVPVEAVDLAAPAPEVRDCGAPTSGPGDPAPSEGQAQDVEPAPPPHPAPTALPSRSPASASDPAPVARQALTAGIFVPNHPAGFLLSMGSGIAWLNKQSAAAHRIGDSGATFNSSLGFTIWDVFMVSGALSVAFPPDHASFKQQVVPEVGGGDPRTEESSLTVLSYSIAAGLRSPFLALGSTSNGWVATALFAEYGTAGVSGTRSISNCVDCREDELSMSGGPFWRVGVDLLVPSRKPTVSYGLTVSYQRYAADAGFGGELRIAFTGWWLSRGSRGAAGS